MMVHSQLLIIGYGNQLRGDDAAGVEAAQRIADQNWPDTNVVIQQQLTPEISEQISHAKTVVFLDASASPELTSTRVEAIEPGASDALPTHLGDPRSLLALTQILYDQSPPAWLITIPARNFDFGAPISDITKQGIEMALREVKKLQKENEPKNNN